MPNDEIDMGESVWAQGRKDTLKGWSSRWFVVTDVLLIPAFALFVDPLAAVAFAAGSLFFVWLGATAGAPIHQRNEARDAWVRLAATPELRIVDDLRAVELIFCGQKIPGDEALLHFAHMLRMGLARVDDRGVDQKTLARSQEDRLCEGGRRDCAVLGGAWDCREV